METWPPYVETSYECIIPRVTVRETHELDSTIVAFLTPGIIVNTTGRRIHQRIEIQHPVKGWISLKNSRNYACVWPLNVDNKPTGNPKSIQPKLQHMDSDGRAVKVASGTMTDYAVVKASKSSANEKEYHDQLIRYFTTGCDVEICDSRRDVWKRAQFHSFQNTYLIATMPDASKNAEILYSCSLSTIRRLLSKGILSILNELQSTEEEYIKNLKAIDEIFFANCDLPELEPLRLKLKLVKNLIKGHDRFAANLRAANFNIYSLCQIFDDKASFLQYYQQYYEVVSQVISVQRRLIMENKAVREYFATKPSFDIYVQRPVKRSMVYQEFLKQLLKKTEYDFEKFLLTNTLNKYKTSMFQLNEKKDDLEHKLKTTQTAGRIQGFTGDLFNGGRREFYEEFICYMKGFLRNDSCKLYFASDSIMITDCSYFLKYYIPYSFITLVEKIPENGIKIVYNLPPEGRTRSSSFWGKNLNMDESASKTINFYGDTDGLWYKSIQRTWHAAFDTLIEHKDIDKRRGINNVEFSPGSTRKSSNDKISHSGERSDRSVSSFSMHSRSVSEDQYGTRRLNNVEFEASNSRKSSLALVQDRSRVRLPISASDHRVRPSLDQAFDDMEILPDIQETIFLEMP